jgi:hypothetical protein
LTGNALSPDEAALSPTATKLNSFISQRLSCSLVKAAGQQMERGIRAIRRALDPLNPQPRRRGRPPATRQPAANAPAGTAPAAGTTAPRRATASRTTQPSVTATQQHPADPSDCLDPTGTQIHPTTTTRVTSSIAQSSTALLTNSATRAPSSVAQSSTALPTNSTTRAPSSIAQSSTNPPPAPPNSQIQRAPVRCPGLQPLGQLTRESREDLARTARQGATDSQPTPKPGANPASQGRQVSPPNPQPAKPPCSPRHAFTRRRFTQTSSSALPPAHRRQSLPSVCQRAA